MNEQNQMDEITPDMQEQIKEIKEILDSPEIDPTMALNIIINAVQVCYDSEDVFNDLDKALISKALTCFQDKVKKGENFEIKVAE